MEELMKKTKAGQSAPASETEPKKEIRPAQEQESKKMDENCHCRGGDRRCGGRLHGQGIPKRQTPISAAAIWWLRPPGRI